MVSRATLSSFFENSELKTTHNSFRDRRVLFFNNLSRSSCTHDMRAIYELITINF